MTDETHGLDPRFVEVARTAPLTVDPENLDCLIDVFCLADGSRKFVVLTHDGEPILLTEAVALASRRIRQQLAVHDMVSDQAPRCLDVDELHLMVIGHAEQAMDLQGPNDPVNLRGRISGPWLSAEPAVLCESQLIVMRADLLQALSEGFLDQFLTPSSGSSGARVWNNLWLPCADEGVIRKGKGCVLAYPHNALAGFLETGNDLATRTIAEKLLQDFQRDLQKDNIPGRLREETLPVASLRNHRDELEANGIVIKDDAVVASLPENTGWLKRVYHSAFPKMEALPAEGDVGMFCSLAAVAICDLGDWPNARSRALTQRLTRYRAMWTAQLHSRLQPVRNPRDGNFEIVNGILEAKAGVNPSSKCLYFDVEDGFAATIDDAVELEFEYRDDKGPPIVVSYNGKSDPYTQAERVSRGGTGKWLTSSLSLMDVDFQNAQNSGADFRIEFGNSAGAIRSIVLKASPKPTLIASKQPG